MQRWREGEAVRHRRALARARCCRRGNAKRSCVRVCGWVGVGGCGGVWGGPTFCASPTLTAGTAPLPPPLRLPPKPPRLSPKPPRLLPKPPRLPPSPALVAGTPARASAGLTTFPVISEWRSTPPRMLDRRPARLGFAGAGLEGGACAPPACTPPAPGGGRIAGRFVARFGGPELIARARSRSRSRRPGSLPLAPSTQHPLARSLARAPPARARGGVWRRCMRGDRGEGRGGGGGGGSTGTGVRAHGSPPPASEDEVLYALDRVHFTPSAKRV